MGLTPGKMPKIPSNPPNENNTRSLISERVLTHSENLQLSNANIRKAWELWFMTQAEKEVDSWHNEIKHSYESPPYENWWIEDGEFRQYQSADGNRFWSCGIQGKVDNIKPYIDCLC